MDQPRPLYQDAIAQNERLQFALQSANVGTWDLNITQQQVWWDECCKRLYGFRQDDTVPYDQVLSYLHPDDRQRVNQAVQWALDPRSAGQYEVQFRTIGAEDGQLRWLHCRGRAYFDALGQPYRFSGTAQEVSQLILARQALEASEARFRQLVTSSPTGTVVFTGRNMRVELINQPMLKIWGKDESVVGKLLHEAMPELIGQPFLELLQRVYDTGQAFHSPNGKATIAIEGTLHDFWFNFSYSPLYDENGQIYGIINTATDVTAQVYGHRQVEDSEARFRSLVEEAPVATCLFVGRELRIELANQAMIEVWGKGPNVLGLPLADALPELRDQHFLTTIDQVFTTGKAYSAKAGRADLRIDGYLQTFYFNYDFKALRNVQGQVYAIMETATDVTAQVVAHQQLEASEGRYRQLSENLEQQVKERTEELVASNEELAAINEELTATNEDFVASNQALETANTDLLRSNQNLEQFAYIASHDMQEPLRKIQQFGDLLKGQYGQALGDGAMYLERMQVAASRMSVLIKDLLAFSRIATTQVVAQPVPLSQVVSRVLETLSVAMEESGAQVEVTRLPTVPGDALQLGQLFQNLLSNALKFRRTSPEWEVVTPQITIKASLVAGSVLPATVHPARYAEMYHRIEVADNGVGFDEKYTDRIFQVFQRLHGRNEFAGTGIGLAIVQKVVTNHGGAITASSKPGEGATFSVYLPA